LGAAVRQVSHMRTATLELTGCAVVPCRVLRCRSCMLLGVACCVVLLCSCCCVCLLRAVRCAGERTCTYPHALSLR
jgi:hypothetical protein